MNPLNLIFIIMGYLFFTLSSSNQTGGDNKFDLMLREYIGTPIDTSLRFEHNNIHIHIHHWVVLLGIYCFIYFMEDSIQERAMMYFCLGGTIQGIVNYDDWYHLVTYRTP